MYHIILYIAGIFHIGFYKTFDIDNFFCSSGPRQIVQMLIPGMFQFLYFSVINGEQCFGNIPLK